MNAPLILDDGHDAQLVRGRRAPFALMPHWIPLSGATAMAVQLYSVLLLHVNTERGDRVVWPGRPALAAFLGLELPKSVDRYIAELVKLGAIDKLATRKPGGGTGPNCYVVHETPPDGYTGPTSLTDWYTKRNQGGIDSSEAKTPAHPPVPETVPPPRYSSEDWGGPQMNTPPQVSVWGPELEEVQLEENNKTKKNPPEDGSLRSPSSGGRASAPPPPEQTPAIFDVPTGPQSDNDHVPKLPTGPEGAAGKVQRRGRRERTMFPEDWEAPHAALQWAATACPHLTADDLARETQAVILWSRGKGEAYRDHTMMWKKWMLRAEKDQAQYLERQAARQANGSGNGVTPYRGEAWAPENEAATVAAWKELETRPMPDTAVSEEEMDASVRAQAAAANRRRTEQLRRQRGIA